MAAWLIVQQAVSNGEAVPWQGAMLEDRIRMYEGKPQIYGSQFQPDENGQLNPYQIENPESVNDRRLAVGLNTIEERTAELRAQRARENISTPPDLEEQFEKWLYFSGGASRIEARQSSAADRQTATRFAGALISGVTKSSRVRSICRQFLDLAIRSGGWLRRRSIPVLFRTHTSQRSSISKESALWPST